MLCVLCGVREDARRVDKEESGEKANAATERVGGVEK